MAQIIYRSGDPKSAAPLFEQVMQIAPKLNLAESSRICLEAIQKGEAAAEPPEILPDPNYLLRPPAEEAYLRRYNRIRNTLLCALFLLLLVGIIVTSLF